MNELDLGPEETLPPQLEANPADLLVDVEGMYSELQKIGLPDFPFFAPTVAQVENFFKSRCTLEAALKMVDAADLMIGSMRQTFASELDFYEPAQTKEPAGVVLSAFAWIGTQTLRLKAALRAKEEETALYSLQEIRSALASMLPPFRQMNELADLEPRHSESNDIQEVCRVGYGFLEGRLPQAAFLERLIPYWDKFQFFRKQLADYTPPQQKVAAWNLLYQDFLPTFERVEQMLADMERLAEENDLVNLKEKLNLLPTVGAEIANIELELTKIA